MLCTVSMCKYHINDLGEKTKIQELKNIQQGPK